MVVAAFPVKVELRMDTEPPVSRATAPPMGRESAAPTHISQASGLKRREPLGLRVELGQLACGVRNVIWPLDGSPWLLGF